MESGGGGGCWQGRGDGVVWGGGCILVHEAPIPLLQFQNPGPALGGVVHQPLGSPHAPHEAAVALLQRPAQDGLQRVGLEASPPHEAPIALDLRLPLAVGGPAFRLGIEDLQDLQTDVFLLLLLLLSLPVSSPRAAWLFRRPLQGGGRGRGGQRRQRRGRGSASHEPAVALHEAAVLLGQLVLWGLSGLEVDGGRGPGVVVLLIQGGNLVFLVQ